MSNADLLPFLLFKINQNQLALEAAIMELTLCRRVKLAPRAPNAETRSIHLQASALMSYLIREPGDCHLTLGRQSLQRPRSRI